MRILTAGPALWISAGYSTQLRELCRRLMGAGHEVVHFAFAGTSGGGRIAYGGVTHLPGDGTSHGNHVIHAHVHHVQPDFVLSLCDTWACDGYGEPRWRWAPWTPIDHTPAPPRTVHALTNQATWPIAMSEHGAQMMRDAKVEPAALIPHGVGAWAHPDAGAGEEWRRVYKVPPEAYVFGTVALNSWWPERKGLNRLLYAFRQALDAGGDFAEPPDKGGAALFLHTTRRNHVGTADTGFELNKLVDELDLAARVWFTDPYVYLLGLDDDGMRALYNSFNAFVLPTMGEGFGIPVIEAQACAVPVLATDCTSMPELVKTGELVPTEGRILTMGYAFQHLVSIDALADRMRAWYGSDPSVAVEEAVAMDKYRWDAVWERCWVPFLDRVEYDLATRSHKSLDVPAAVAALLPPQYVAQKVLSVNNQGVYVLTAECLQYQPDHNLRTLAVKVVPRTSEHEARFGSLLVESHRTHALRQALLAAARWSAGDGPVPILDAWEGPQSSGYAMPLYETTLAKLDTLEYGDACHISQAVEQVVAGLVKLGWEHRDLHPTNVLLRRSSQGWCAAVADWTWMQTTAPGERSVDMTGEGPSAVPTVRWRLDERSIHTIRRALFEKTYPDVVERLQLQRATGRYDKPYQQVFGWGERSCEDRWQQLGPPDVAGKSVIDLGCNLGLFGKCALLAGATGYRGLDKDAPTIDAARVLQMDWINDVTTDAEAEFAVRVVTGGLWPSSRFDVGLALGLVMHVDKAALYTVMRRGADLWYFEAPREDEYQYKWSTLEWELDLAQLGSVKCIGMSDRGRSLFEVTIDGRDAAV